MRKEIIELIKNENKVFLVYGEENYLIREAEERFKGILEKSMMDFNLSILSGDEIEVEDIYTSVNTLPFMDEKRLVIVKNYNTFLDKSKSKKKEDLDRFIDIISDIPDTSILVFIVEGNIDKRRDFYKKIIKHTKVFEFNRLEDIKLFSWCKDRFSELEISVNNSEISYFIEVSGYRDKNSEINLDLLYNEIKKLSDYVGRGQRLKKEDIDNNIKKKVEDDIFLLIDMIASKNSKRAMKIFEDMVESGESILGIFFMLSRQFNMILQAYTMLKERLPQNIIKESLNIKQQFVLNKILRQSKTFDEKKLIEMLNYISDFDFKIKQGLISDRLSAEIFISKFCV